MLNGPVDSWEQTVTIKLWDLEEVCVNPGHTDGEPPCWSNLQNDICLIPLILLLVAIQPHTQSHKHSEHEAKDQIIGSVRPT